MTGEPQQKDWTPARIALLRALWAEGLSTAAIGQHLQVSKNAVIGKVHRLHLPSRPSPVRAHQAGGAGTRTVPPVAPPPPIVLATLPKQTSNPEPVPTPLGVEAGVIRPVSMPRPRPQRPCAWPLGHPGTSGFRYCGEDAVPTKPYCEQHCCRAYVRSTGQADATA